MNIIDFFFYRGYKILHVAKTRDERKKEIAWQTALIMNATGRPKKTIQQEDLYTSPFDKQGNITKPKVINKQYVKEERDKLKQKFNIGD